MTEKLYEWLKILKKFEFKVRESLKVAPAGSVVIKKCRKYRQYYVGRQYVSKKKTEYLSSLIQKKYDLKVLRETEVQKKAVTGFLKLYRPDYLKDLFSQFDSGTRALLVSTYDVSDEQYAVDWQNGKYVKNKYPFTGNQFFSSKGEQMRSKSEVIIADRLAAMNIPYSYECALTSGSGETIFPDFTILKKRTREIFYLEHFGIMDSDEYRTRQFFRKLRIYSDMNISPAKNLIMSFEDRNNPLNTAYLDFTIKKYLL